MTKFVNDNDIDESYKFHFSFSDHGSMRKIPLKKGILMNYDLSLDKLEGMNFNIIKDEWSISKDLSVNYIGKFIKN